MKKKRKKLNTNRFNTYDFEKFRKNIKNDLTDNVKVNVILSPLYFIGIFLFIKTEYSHLPLFSTNNESILLYSFISTFVYIYASHYFQPDLDVYSNRPGMGHFPLGKKIGFFRLGRFFKWLFFPINRIWYHMWTPYARLFTHRGITHWPILSTIIRVSYLLCIFLILKSFVDFLGFENKLLNLIIYWLKNFFLKFDFFYFILFNFPIYISDLAHIIVDYRDSSRKGISFCSPKLPRGILYQIYDTIKGGKSL